MSPIKPTRKSRFDRALGFEHRPARRLPLLAHTFSGTTQGGRSTARRFSWSAWNDSTTETPSFSRQRRTLDAPPRDVHFVHALIPRVAVARIPEPVPVVVDQVAVVRLFRRGAEPQVEIELRRRRGLRNHRRPSGSNWTGWANHHPRRAEGGRATRAWADKNLGARPLTHCHPESTRAASRCARRVRWLTSDLAVAGT